MMNNGQIRPDEVANHLKEAYIDKETKELLFGTQDVAARHIRGAQPLLRIILSGALFSYLYFVENKELAKEEERSEYFLKVEELCGSLFKENELNIDSACYLLFLMHTDLEINGKNSFFANVMDNIIECEFGKIYGLLDEWNSSKERILTYYKPQHIFSYMIYSTMCLKILRLVDITIKDNDVIFEYDKKMYKCAEYMKFDVEHEVFLLLTKKPNDYLDFRNLVHI